ncbi:MAG TPA: fused MFS/spermidine synthase, partial [Terriglobales bacterium]|nr:fused MFS/spermidine synthase [Terriglobales bacterium]
KAAQGHQRALRFFGLGILLSAFLLFQLELIFAKHILPWFGGTPSVWTTCMLFFQLMLLAGYAFADWGARRLSPRLQAGLQFGVIAMVGILFGLAMRAWGSPLTPTGQIRELFAAHPVLHILMVLALGAGAPFFLLATTGPVLQHWFRIGAEGASPYRLYALSNIGSLFGLICYPFLLEWLFTLQHQAWLWNGLFALFAVVYALLCRAVRSWPEAISAPPAKVASTDAPRWRMRVVWAALAACGSAMLLATTNLLCEDVPVTPALWVMPLCLYLLSFILAFDHPRWYQRWIFYPLYAAALWIALRLLSAGINLDLVYRSDAYLFIVFVVCMVCHGELARSKPDPRHLTSFYLLVSLGGVIGGVLVSIVAPRVFTGYWEFHIGLLACGVLALGVLLIDRHSWLHPGAGWKGAIAGALLMAAALQGYRAASAQMAGREYRRDFFGVKQIYEQGGIRFLRNGGVEHGGQYTDEQRRREPMMYYSHHTGVGQLLTNYPKPAGRGRRIGVVGLGTGALAAYGLPGDSLRFWEIDPQVIQLAKGPAARFTYVQDSRATVEVVEADGRLAIENEYATYDILVLDAFSGDAIPMHLITREAFRLYLSRLSGPDAVVAFHISNRIVDLTPVMLAFSRSEHVPVRFFMGMSAEYAIFSRNPAMLDAIGPDDSHYHWDEVDSVLWTDGYSNLLQVLRR